MAIKLVVFDMAGTTVEDADNVHQALIRAFSSESLKINRNDANEVMGIPKDVAIRTILENKFGQVKAKFELITKIHDVFIAEMIHFYQNDPTVRPKFNAEQTFSLLKKEGIKV